MPIVVKSPQPATARDYTSFVNTTRPTAVGAGDQTLIANATTDRRIIILSMTYVQITSGVVTFKMGSNTKFTLSALNTAQVELDAGGWPLCVGGLGEAFISNHAGAGSLITSIRYMVVP